MPITLNPPVVITAHKREGESSSPVLDFLPAHAANILYKGKTVKDALDELFEAFAPPLPERGWQKFTETGQFTVPEGVTRVLVMCIGAGASSTTSYLGAGTFLSRYVSVTPGAAIPVAVGKPQGKGKPPKEELISSFGTYLSANNCRRYAVEGNDYTHVPGQDPTFPPELEGLGMVTVTGRYYTKTTHNEAGPGSGGYAVAADVPDERVAWLELARDMPPGTEPSGRACYPDTSQKATAASGRYAGSGANYGGSAGRFESGEAYPAYAGTGSDGLVCVFWGDDIEKVAPAPSSSAYRKEHDTTITKLDIMVDASIIPYTNEEVGLAKGSTVADALDALYARLAEKEQSA